MKLAVFTHVQHMKRDELLYGYAPYVNEMNIWFKYADEVIIVAPVIKANLTAIDTTYCHDRITLYETASFDVTSIRNIFKTIIKLPKLLTQIFKAMKSADHIHLRCPGNMGLLAAIVQIAFPKKKKTAKYAGNWDPKSKQPLSYRLQKWILSNTFLTKNMQVLVYGEWPKQSKNIKSFFTATYGEDEIPNSDFQKSDFQNEINFLFVGTLSAGKQPLYAIQLVEELKKRGRKVTLDLFGDGTLRGELENYIKTHNLESIVFLKGNQPKEVIEKAYQKSHFLVLPSKSEGWPKVVAEAMFWGCVPLVTPVSCVPYMLDEGNRGVLLTMEVSKDSDEVLNLLAKPASYTEKSENAKAWSRKFTVDLFENEIKKLI